MCHVLRVIHHTPNIQSTNFTIRTEFMPPLFTQFFSIFLKVLAACRRLELLAACAAELTEFAQAPILPKRRGCRTPVYECTGVAAGVLSVRAQLEARLHCPHPRRFASSSSSPFLRAFLLALFALFSRSLVQLLVLVCLQSTVLRLLRFMLFLATSRLLARLPCLPLVVSFFGCRPCSLPCSLAPQRLCPPARHPSFRSSSQFVLAPQDRLGVVAGGPRCITRVGGEIRCVTSDARR